jgi:hypothetical protein
MMVYKRQEWIERFGAKFRTERPAALSEPLPKAMVAKLKTLADAEARLKNKKSET